MIVFVGLKVDVCVLLIVMDSLMDGVDVGDDVGLGDGL